MNKQFINSLAYEVIVNFARILPPDFPVAINSSITTNSETFEVCKYNPMLSIFFVNWHVRPCKDCSIDLTQWSRKRKRKKKIIMSCIHGRCNKFRYINFHTKQSMITHHESSVWLAWTWKCYWFKRIGFTIRNHKNTPLGACHIPGFLKCL